MLSYRHIKSDQACKISLVITRNYLSRINNSTICKSIFTNETIRRLEVAQEEQQKEIDHIKKVLKIA
jgi:hypothetical protein